MLYFRLICLLLPIVMALAKGWRTCGLMSDTEYRIMFEAVSEGTYHVPVAERTPLERSTLRRFHRNKEFYSIENNRLYYKGKELLCESKCSKVITNNYHKSKGIGVRRLYHLLKRRYTGVSEAKIKQVIY